MENSRIDSYLARELETWPDVEHNLLVRVQRADDQAEETLRSLGLDVRRRFRLVSSFSVRGPGNAALKLLDYSWVQRIEEDRAVHTMESPLR